jgi:hypothetical protein
MRNAHLIVIPGEETYEGTPVLLVKSPPRRKPGPIVLPHEHLIFGQSYNCFRRSRTRDHGSRLSPGWQWGDRATLTGACPRSCWGPVRREGEHQYHLGRSTENIRSVISVSPW